MEELLYIIFFLVYIAYQIYKAVSSGKKPRAPRPQGDGPTLEDIFRELSGEPKPKASPPPDPIPQQPPAQRIDTFPEPTVMDHEESVEAAALREIRNREKLDTVPEVPEYLADHSSHIAERFQFEEEEEAEEGIEIVFDRDELRKAIIYAEIIQPKYF